MMPPSDVRNPAMGGGARGIDHATKQISPAPRNLRPADWLAGVAVYDGLRLVGRVLHRQGRHKAFDDDGRWLGEFPTHGKATAAIIAAHRGERRAT